MTSLSIENGQIVHIFSELQMHISQFTFDMRHFHGQFDFNHSIRLNDAEKNAPKNIISDLILL